jgi:hypothetical protein
MRSAIELLRAKTVMAIAVATFLCTSALMPAHADDTVRAVWQVQDIYFPYFGFTTHYSCDGLRDKVRATLKQLGVREGYLVNSAACTDLIGPERSPSVRIVVANAVPASDEVVNTFATDPNRAKLVAQLQKKSKTPIGDAPFDAIPKRVTLHAKDSSDVGAAGDCELLEQLQRVVFPKLGVKVLRDNVSCTPHQGTVGNPSIEVELLVAAPAKA